MDIRLAQIKDAEAIRGIYNNEVTSGTATFDITPRTPQEQRDWLTERSGVHVVLVAEYGNQIIGFGSLFGKNETIEGEDEDNGNGNGNGVDIKTPQDVEDTQGKGDDVQPIFGIGNTNDINPQILKKCKMYLPAAIPFRDTASYENADLGMAGGIAEAGGKASEGLIQSLFSGVGQTAAAAFGGSGGEGLGRLAMTKISVSKYLGGEGTALAVKQAAGVTMNPNTRSLFKSVALREFAFQFKFIPLSKQ